MITMDADDILRDRFRNSRVCSECVEEPDLQHYIVAADGEPGCSFCDGDDAPTCEFLDFMGHVSGCISEEYDLAGNWLPWEGREGGWQWGPVWRTYELVLYELGIRFPREGSDELVSAMEDLLGDQEWCVIDPYGEDPLEDLRLRWQQFCDLIKHRTRFFFHRLTPPPSDEFLRSRQPASPAKMLHAIGDRIERMELCRNYPADLTVYRARHCTNGPLPRTPQELGPPPPERAFVANRMSPPGIVMFYAALDPDTALLETAAGPGLFAVAEFRVRRPARLLDLTRLPEVPGFFASIPNLQRWGRLDARFFTELVRDFTRPTERDDRVHIEYIPTQVVTEYFRIAFHDDHDTEPLDGIVYPSARNCGKQAVVLFADRAAVTDIVPVQEGESDTTWLELTDVKYFEGTLPLQFSPMAVPFE